MKFFKKPSTKIIEFIPLDEYAPLFPPKPAKMTLPDWYKNLDPYNAGMRWTAESMVKNNFPATTSSIKKCLPVQDYILNGYTIFTNTDVLLSNYQQDDGIQRFYWSIPRQAKDVVGMHPHVQCPIDFDGKKHDYFKVWCQWGIRTPPGYSCLTTQPFYQKEDRFTLFPAIVDTDKDNETIGFIGYLNPKYEHIKIEAGTPIMNIFPFKREDWKMKIVDKNKSKKDNKFDIYKGAFFANVYRNFYWSKKRFD